MSGKCFFDTNTLIYGFESIERAKGDVSRALLQEAVLAKSAVISYQTFQEVINVGLRKFRPPLTVDEVSAYVGRLMRECEIVAWSPDLLARGLNIRKRYQFQWYDCLLVAAALEADCEVFYTEDMQNRQQIGKLRFVDPFR